MNKQIWGLKRNIMQTYYKLKFSNMTIRVQMVLDYLSYLRIPIVFQKLEFTPGYLSQYLSYEYVGDVI